MALTDLPSFPFLADVVADRVNSATAKLARHFDTVAELLADTALSYSGGRALVVGTIVEAGGNRYEVAPSGASAPDATTAGGVKLYRVFGRALEFECVRKPASPPGAVASAMAGVLTGSYYYAVSFVTADGETEASTPSAVVNPAAKQVSLINIPVSADSRVSARKLYRTPAGAPDSVLSQLVTTINDNTTTTYTDNLPDGSLGAAAPYINTTGGVITDAGTRIGNVSQMSVAIGFAALASGGYASTAVGGNALQDNTTGYRNTAFGYDALQHNTTGDANTGVGVHAGGDTTEGSGNCSIGYGALMGNTTGDENIAMGSFAAQTQLTGNRNVSIGAQAQQQRTGGDDNIAIGSQALRSAGTGTGNIALGRLTGYNLLTANFLTAIGHQAANALTTGSSNVAIGLQALYRCVTGLGNICIGANAGSWETGSNKLWVDNQARTDLATAQTLSLLYGNMASVPASQFLTVNGQLNMAAGHSRARTAVAADYTVLATDDVLIVTGTAQVTLTLPSPSTYARKVFRIVNRAAFAVASASGNVVPLAGGAATTAILPATAGAWVDLQSNGTSWEIIGS